MDNTAPSLALRVAGVDAPEAPRHAAEGVTAIEVLADEPSTVAVNVDGAPAGAGPAAPGSPYRLDLLWRNEGRAEVTVSAVDAVGNARIGPRYVHVHDVTAPTLTVERTDFVDERLLNRWPLPADLSAAALPRVVLDEASVTAEEGVEIARQVHRWAGAVEGEPDNPVVLRLRGADAQSKIGRA